MKKKIGDLTFDEFKVICDKYYDENEGCYAKCPFYRGTVCFTTVNNLTNEDLEQEIEVE